MTIPVMPLRFFHGTHSDAVATILSEGLCPQANPASAMRGNLSTIPGYTDRMVFLAPSIEEAAFYAREQAEHIGAEPVIFEVLIWHEQNLRVSDDYRRDQAIEAMLEFANLPPLEYDEDMDVHQYGTSSDAYYFWREVLSRKTGLAVGGADLALTPKDKEDATEIMGALNIDALWARMTEAVRDTEAHPWRNSIATDRDPSVAHEGAIPSSDLYQVSEALVHAAIGRIGRGGGDKKEWDLSPPANHPGLHGGVVLGDDQVQFEEGEAEIPQPA